MLASGKSFEMYDKSKRYWRSFDAYHRSGEGHDDVTIRARIATRAETSAVVSQVAAVGGSQSCKGR